MITFNTISDEHQLNCPGIVSMKSWPTTNGSEAHYPMGSWRYSSFQKESSVVKYTFMQNVLLLLKDEIYFIVIIYFRTEQLNISVYLVEIC